MNPKLLILLIILFLNFPPEAYCKTVAQNKPIYIEEVGQIYKTDIPRKLRKALDSYAKLNYDKKENRLKIDKIKGLDSIEDVIYTQYLFRKKFLIGAVKEMNYKNNCASKSYDIAIYSNPDQVEFVVIRIGESDLRVCGIMIERDFRKEKAIFKGWKDSEYWI